MDSKHIDYHRLTFFIYWRRMRVGKEVLNYTCYCMLLPNSGLNLVKSGPDFVPAISTILDSGRLGPQLTWLPAVCRAT